MPYPRDPFQMDSSDANRQESEFGWGAGRFPNPVLDYSGGGSISKFPIADPDRTQQIRTLAEIKRMDLGNPGDAPSPYVAGNTDRYGAQPPLVRETRTPKYVRPEPPQPARMKRAW